MITLLNAGRLTDVNRVIMFCSASLKLMKGALRRRRVFERSNAPDLKGGMLAMPRRSIAREIEELYPDSY
jgi:hypothetical protein